ncbi:dynein axonemal assembly factor 3 homolog [Tribolium castaneum]|uniref:Dynein assembly factor 3, axonemal homolog-like Protein n=1 Tax=Tribolium castaneum TaxID=7070 RepID=D6WZ56_TRICA|nr:PREDICTED: dynein assembly factor 3, axonemal homolog [Tribolium castaneum]EFA10380.1 Dynein assembly factor 3, axonemal homolog-like Protein [Tribolium castaneum]|eukprot:XP_974391.1 PREDICTED: dynein assembly factor 3, axonemal homolog [Tribolium castaneum]
MFWGLSPALDLQEQYLKENKTLPEELNILLVGGADSRHVLQTLARRYRHTTTKLNFYVMEASVETIAKQLLLLNVALQDPSIMGLVQKVKFFMELYGNTLVRPAVAKFLTATATQLVKMVTDYEYLNQVMPFVTLEIKYKERDYLENLLKFWCGRDEFDICDYWDRRLRKNLGVRYDSKLGAFDWDLHMRLHSVGGKQLCNQEYRNFRLNGVAFSWLESEVSKPNRSMVCLAIPNGEKFVHYGYLGDMQTGPFVSFGLECEDENYLKATNGQNMHRATDVTERNLCQIFHEIQYGETYSHRNTSDKQLGPVVMQVGEKRVIDTKTNETRNTAKNKCIDLEDVSIKFVSLSLLKLMLHKNEYREFFQIIYFGCFYTEHLNKDLVDRVLAKDGLVLVENQKFVVTHRDKQLQEFGENVRKALEGSKLTESCFDPCKDNFARFVKA